MGSDDKVLRKIITRRFLNIRKDHFKFKEDIFSNYDL